MSSASQIAANQANSQLSTGPRNQSGNHNARTHGLTAQHLKIDPQDQPAFDSLSQALRRELSPHGELESALFDRLLHSHWKLRKLDAIEAGLLAAFDPFNEKHSLTLNRLSLYRSRTESSLYKAQAELRALQEERHLRASSLDNPTVFSPIIRVASVQKNFALLNRRKKKPSQFQPSPDFRYDQL